MYAIRYMPTQYLPYILYHTSYIDQQSHRHPVWPTMSGSFICGFVVLMEPFPLGGGLLLLGEGNMSLMVRG